MALQREAVVADLEVGAIQRRHGVEAAGRGLDLVEQHRRALPVGKALGRRLRGRPRAGGTASPGRRAPAAGPGPRGRPRPPAHRPGPRAPAAVRIVARTGSRSTTAWCGRSVTPRAARWRARSRRMRSANSTPPVGVNSAKRAPSKRRNGRRAASCSGVQRSAGRSEGGEARERALDPAALLARHHERAGRLVVAAAEVRPEPLPGGVGVAHHARVAVHRAIGEADQPVLVGRRGERVGQRPLLVERHAHGPGGPAPRRRQAP